MLIPVTYALDDFLLSPVEKRALGDLFSVLPSPPTFKFEDQFQYDNSISTLPGDCIYWFNTTASIDLNRIIQRHAYFISIQSPSYDELCWFLAKAILRLSFLKSGRTELGNWISWSSYDTDYDVGGRYEGGWNVYIPSAAQSIHANNLSIPDLHWLLAERMVWHQILSDQAHPNQRIIIRDGHVVGLDLNRVLKGSLHALPESLWQLEHLETLNLSDNQLIALPEEIGKLLLLSVLDASFNKITHIPDAVLNLSMLKEINLKYNPLAVLPPHCESLKVLISS